MKPLHSIPTPLAIIFLMTCALHSATGQVDVLSFRQLENDLTARAHSPVRDANHDLCALIKLVSTEDGFEFEGGMLGFCASISKKTAEWWIFVPPKARTLTIQHPVLGIIRNYAYPIPIESGNVYEMTLIHGTIEKTVKPPQIKTEWLVIKSDPPGADVWIDGKSVGKTPYSSEMPEGTYNWRIEQTLYLAETGTVQLKEGTKGNVDIKLPPNYGTLQITSEPENGAKVLLNGMDTGKQTPCTLDKVPAGEHQLTLSHEWFATTTQTVSVGAGQTTKPTITMSPNFGTLVITATPGSDIYLNNQKVGTGSHTARLPGGSANAEARAESHHPAKERVTIEVGKTKDIQLTPAPMYGSIRITSDPMDAEVLIDGKKAGTTPMTAKNVLAGERTITLKLKDHQDHTTKVIVNEGSTNDANVTLKKGDQSFSATSNNKGILIGPDGKLFNRWGQEIALPSEIQKLISDMVFVTGGTFMMGCTNEQGNDCHVDEKPSHKITVSDFRICKFEVTQSQWKTIMDNSGSSISPSHFINCENCPVESVSWNKVQEFISRLNQLTGLEFSLPTEAEWEYCARGGNSSQNFKYCGSNQINSVAWYGKNSDSKTHPVGSKKANELDLYDLSGNVSEWCSDWYSSDFYSVSPEFNPSGPSSGSPKVFRGGSWKDSQSNCRISCRDIGDRDFSDFNIGFRLVIRQ